MIRHCVFLRLLPAANHDTLAEVMADLADVVAGCPGCSNFVAGVNLDLENRSAAYPFGFTLDAESRAALDGYATDPRHQALGARLVALCGGQDGVLVFDLDI